MARHLVLPEVVVSDKRLGRHIRHDPRSLAYRVQGMSGPVTTTWARRIPILDQGNLGSCTGNATVGCVGSEPYFSALTPVQQATLNESLAVSIYSAATAIDGAPGTYPPDDTGSDGLSVATVAKKRGLISGYRHITVLAEAYSAIQDGPFIFGGSWMSGMDNPSAEGVVKATGSVRGGHEWLVRCYDAAKDLWECDNSWGNSFGVNGSFYFSSATFQYLLSQQGDATPFVPLNKPAPVPIPVPPTPAPSDPAYQLWLATVDPAYQKWTKHSVLGRRGLIASVEAWKLSCS